MACGSLYYSCAIGALTLKPSDFCNNGVYAIFFMQLWGKLLRLLGNAGFFLLRLGEEKEGLPVKVRPLGIYGWDHRR
jgi:hypothetical protein